MDILKKLSFVLKKERARKGGAQKIKIAVAQISHDLSKMSVDNHTQVLITDIIERVRGLRRYSDLSNNYQHSVLIKGKKDGKIDLIVNHIAHHLESHVLSVNAKSFVTETKRHLPLNVEELFESARAYRPAIIHISNIDILNSDPKKIKGDGDYIVATVKSYMKLTKAARKIQVSENTLLIVSTEKPENICTKKSFSDAFPIEIALHPDLIQKNLKQIAVS